MLLKEPDGITRLSAPEALIDAQVGADIEGRRLLVVERAQAEVARSLAFQRDEFAHYLFYPGGFFDELYCERRDHRSAKIPVRDGMVRDRGYSSDSGADRSFTGNSAGKGGSLVAKRLG